MKLSMRNKEKKMEQPKEQKPNKPGNCVLCKNAGLHDMCRIKERIPAPNATEPNRTKAGRAYGPRDPQNCGRYEIDEAKAQAIKDAEKAARQAAKG